MRAVIQRVTHASVRVNENKTGQIGSGLLVLLGIEQSDTEADLDWLCKKICNMRIFNDADNVMNLSVKDTRGNILLVSQFTLHASTRKGNRPSYMLAATPEVAMPLYEKMIIAIQNETGVKPETGIFGASMMVELTNDGPVTIIIDSKKRE